MLDKLIGAWNEVKEELFKKNSDAYNEVENQIEDLYDQIEVYQEVISLFFKLMINDNAWELDILLPILKQCDACFKIRYQQANK